MSNRFEKLTTR